MIYRSVQALGCFVALISPASSEPPSVRTIVLADPGDKPKYYCWEPHIAASPDDPDLVVVSAMYRGVIGDGEKARGDCALTVWRSQDGGRSWSEPVAPLVGRERPARRIGSDAVCGFGLGRSCWLAGCDYDFPVAGQPGYSSIKVSLSEDGGLEYQPPVTVTELDNETSGKGVVDKPWIAVDATDGPRAGRVYVAWTRLNFDREPGRAELWCTAVRPGGREPTQAVQLGESIELKHMFSVVHQVQLAVRPDGTLDAVWRRADAADRIIHSFSRDGGTTFTQPEPISADTKAMAGQFPSLAATADGRLLAAWGNRGDVFAAVHASGTWSDPRGLAGDLPDGGRLTHPAVAASADALWVLAYRHEQAPARVRVVLYRSTDGQKWAEHATLAARDLSEGERATTPGDYVGLAAANGRVYAAYVLPGEGKGGAGPRLHVSVLDLSAQR